MQRKFGSEWRYGCDEKASTTAMRKMGDSLAQLILIHTQSKSVARHAAVGCALPVIRLFANASIEVEDVIHMIRFLGRSGTPSESISWWPTSRPPGRCPRFLQNSAHPRFRSLVGDKRSDTKRSRVIGPRTNYHLHRCTSRVNNGFEPHRPPDFQSKPESQISRD